MVKFIKKNKLSFYISGKKIALPKVEIEAILN